MSHHVNIFEAYKELGVHRGSSDDDIKAAHKRLSMEFHPDRPGADSSLFMRVQEAYRHLKGVSRLQHLDALKFQGNPCCKCSGTGTTRKQKKFTVVIFSACTSCGGCGYVKR